MGKIGGNRKIYIRGVESLERVFIALGSNLSPRGVHLAEAREMLKHIAVGGWKESPIYETPPVGPVGQGPYFNQVVSFWYTRGKDHLLNYLKGTELFLGRKPRGHWQAREIDLDLLFFRNHNVEDFIGHVDSVNSLANAVSYFFFVSAVSMDCIPLAR